ARWLPPSLVGLARWREWIRRIRPVDARQVMERDASTPAIRRGPEHQRSQQRQQGEAGRRMRSHDAEIDQHDHQAEWQPIADDGEEPGVARLGDEDEAAARTPLEFRPSGIEVSL